MTRYFAFRLTLLALLLFPLAALAQLPRVGNLDYGLSKIQKPLRPHDICTDFHSPKGGRGEDNGVYIGHDEPSMGFYSPASHSGDNMQWEFTLPRERPLPATPTFENLITFWFSLALCDPGSFHELKRQNIANTAKELCVHL